MKRLISTLNLSKEDWLRYRKCGITGTDAGAILGLNPYRSAFQVYHDKISDTIENTDNEAMRQGRDLEDYVAQRFTEATGLKVRRANAIYQSEEHPLLLADFDRLIVGQKAGLECKTVSPFSADKWADGKIPAHYMAQVNHYLAVSGFDCWYIAALIFGKELVIHKITTDKEVLNNLIAKEEHFWKYNVMPEIPPVPTGSEGDTQQINQLYSADDRNKTADLNSELLSLKSKEDCFMTFNAMTERYEEITVCGKPALFTSIRIKRDTVPDGLYAYDVRHDDECRGIPCEIAPFVMVNHWGTIILAEPLDLPDDGRRYIDEDTDWNYAPLDGEGTTNHKPCTTISDFMTAYAH